MKQSQLREASIVPRASVMSKINVFEIPRDLVFCFDRY